MKESLSIILIAHNEEQTIGSMIEGLLNNYQEEILELIVVDDASSDNTAYIVESWMKRDPKLKLIRRRPPCGVGRALKSGFNNVDPKAEYVLTMDSDFTENIKDVKTLINFIEERQSDGVIGSRFVKGGQLLNYPIFKKIMNRLFHFIVKALLHIKQHDLTNNFKLYKALIIRTMPWKSNDYSMNAETGILPIISGYLIEEVPIVWFGRGKKMGKSKFRLHKVGLSYIKVIVYSWKVLRERKRRRSNYGQG